MMHLGTCPQGIYSYTHIGTHFHKVIQTIMVGTGFEFMHIPLQIPNVKGERSKGNSLRVIKTMSEL